MQSIRLSAIPGSLRKNASAAGLIASARSRWVRAGLYCPVQAARNPLIHPAQNTVISEGECVAISIPAWPAARCLSRSPMHQ